jgi:hypothetical protein
MSPDDEFLFTRTPQAKRKAPVRSQDPSGRRTCLVRVEFGKARCRFQGGLSTGPKTEAGRARIAEAQRRRWRAYREGRKGASLATVPICEA